MEILKAGGGDGHTCGVVARDAESGRLRRILAKVVVNATGIFADALRWLDHPDATAMTAPSQGIHLVLDASFQPGQSAIMVPHTDDGRVLFLIPWHGRVLVGTTDTPMPCAEIEPRALPEEIEFVLRNAGRYLAKDPGRGDVLSVFAGQRPLVRGEDTDTKKISREHAVVVSNSGLVTIVGGKWTTYRKMAEDALVDAIAVGGLPSRPCVTETLRLHGYIDREDSGFPADFARRVYGTDLAAVDAIARENPSLALPLHPRLPYTGAQIVFGARHEMARTLEDALARRTRALLLDARADLSEILASTEPRSADPVRPLFLQTWTRLAPILRRISTPLPGETALHYLSLITAADAFTALEQLGPDYGVELNTDGLRRLARMIEPSPLADPLAYSESVDSDLREIFGFGPPLLEPEPEPEGEPSEAPAGDEPVPAPPPVPQEPSF
ncbi:MAG: glycerol-3-phosphate dehydrogenase/oxidase, partial [Myxococcota bacterium]